MKEQFIDFLFSGRWLLIILLIQISIIIKKASLYLYLKTKLNDRTVTKDLFYDENEIIKHLDYLITEGIEEYILLHINPNDNIHYINSKLETEIIDYLKKEIPERISSVLYDKLTFMYSEKYIGEFIGKRIYLSVTQYVLDFNVDNKK